MLCQRECQASGQFQLSRGCLLPLLFCCLGVFENLGAMPRSSSPAFVCSSSSQRLARRPTYGRCYQAGPCSLCLYSSGSSSPWEPPASSSIVSPPSLAPPPFCVFFDFRAHRPFGSAPPPARIETLSLSSPGSSPPSGSGGEKNAPPARSGHTRSVQCSCGRPSNSSSHGLCAQVTESDQGTHLGLFPRAWLVGSGQNDENLHRLVRFRFARASLDSWKIVAL